MKKYFMRGLLPFCFSCGFENRGGEPRAYYGKGKGRTARRLTPAQRYYQRGRK